MAGQFLLVVSLQEGFQALSVRPVRAGLESPGNPVDRRGLGGSPSSPGKGFAEELGDHLAKGAAIFTPDGLDLAQ